MHAKKKKTSAHESAKYDVVYNDKRFLNILALNTAPVADALRVELSRKIDASMEERGRLKAFVYELDENDLPKTYQNDSEDVRERIFKLLFEEIELDDNTLLNLINVELFLKELADIDPLFKSVKIKATIRPRLESLVEWDKRIASLKSLNTWLDDPKNDMFEMEWVPYVLSSCIDGISRQDPYSRDAEMLPRLLNCIVNMDKAFVVPCWKNYKTNYLPSDKIQWYVSKFAIRDYLLADRVVTKDLKLRPIMPGPTLLLFDSERTSDKNCYTHGSGKSLQIPGKFVFLGSETEDDGLINRWPSEAVLFGLGIDDRPNIYEPDMKCTENILLALDFEDNYWKFYQVSKEGAMNMVQSSFPLFLPTDSNKSIVETFASLDISKKIDHGLWYRQLHNWWERIKNVNT